LQDPLLPAEVVPNEDLRFESSAEAYKFYCYYAGKAGFEYGRQGIIERLLQSFHAINRAIGKSISLMKRGHVRRCQ